MPVLFMRRTRVFKPIHISEESRYETDASYWKALFVLCYLKWTHLEMVCNCAIVFWSRHKQVVNTTSEELSSIAIEASVWDLEGICPYYNVFEKFSVPANKTVPIVELKYPKSKNPKPVYFLLLKLYHMSDYGILSRNFYWLHLSGGDYKLLEPYRRKKIPLKITSKVFIKGSTYEIEMHVENVSKKADSRSLTYMNNFTARQGNGDIDMASVQPVSSGTSEKHEVGLFQRICRCFAKDNDGLSVTKVNGANVGVAFFLHFSVHALKTDHKEGEDTRILPVHYSDNYFSLVPSEVMPIKITFEVPPGVTPWVYTSWLELPWWAYCPLRWVENILFMLSMLWKHRHYWGQVFTDEIIITSTQNARNEIFQLLHA